MNKTQLKIYNWLLEHKGYLKKSADNVGVRYPNKSSKKDCEVALKEAKLSLKKVEIEDKTIVVKPQGKISDDAAAELIETIESKKPKKPKVKRLFFDIETSPNVVFSWNVGYKLMIPPDNILKERAIICICWKWAGEAKVHELHWDNGDDKELLVKFSEILNSADEIIGHNSDNYDIKWIRTRCIFHGIPLFPDYTQIDTLKLAKAGFRFKIGRAHV